MTTARWTILVHPSDVLDRAADVFPALYTTASRGQAVFLPTALRDSIIGAITSEHADARPLDVLATADTAIYILVSYMTIADRIRPIIAQRYAGGTTWQYAQAILTSAADPLSDRPVASARIAAILRDAAAHGRR